MNSNSINKRSKNENKRKAISVFSGGLDSTVATAVYAKNYEIHCITFDYGQKSVIQEIKSSKAICEKLGMEHTVIDLKWLANLGSSALTNNEDIPEINLEELDDEYIGENIANKVWVPGRNIVFTAIAVSFAEGEGAEIIIVGWDKEEATTFPDNSKEFLNSFNELIAIGTKTKSNIEIKAPAIDLTKKEIIELGKKVDAPMNISYSCYKNNEKDNIHCGICESCVRRKRAFLEANIEDSTIYEN
ncbi:MAG: 7-cyano-7-deazaguanine synthase QueC [Methanobrevibacter sp.]|nr:7-cyano-7-deazaguanine synthase QueC [Methanobrevibacter sp.]